MKTRNKLISVVLTLALLCPMLSFVLPLEANAVLAPDDGVSNASSSNSIYEEWTFDDLDDGEAVTQGYIDSHINGSFDASMFKDTWTAVTDADSGRKYIRSSNSYFRLSDPGLLLLKNPYEVSFDLMVDSSSNNTDTSMLLWCNDGEGGDGARHALLRYKAASGDIGYYTTSATSNKTGEAYAAPNAVPKGEWHNVRVRVVPSTGLVVLWVDGEYRFHYVNEYLKANAASSEHSALFVWYTWDSGRTACLDNIKITDVKVDENIEFKPYTPVAVGGEWNYNSGTIENGTGITASLGNTTGHLGTKTGVSNDTGMYYLDSSSNNQFEGLRFIFDEPLVNFANVNISYRTYFVSAPMWTNMFYFKNASGSYKTMLRINPMTGTADQMRWRNANDGETNTGNKMVTGVWYTVNLSITPYTGIVDVTVTPDTGTAWSFQATRTDIKDLCNSDGVLDFYLYRQSGTRAEMCIDDVKITTARLTKDTEGSWNFDSQSLASISGFSAPATSKMKYVADPSVTVADGQTATDYVLKTEYDVNTNNTAYGPDITLDERLKNYESVTISFKIRYDAASSLTNLIRFKTADGSTQKVLFRVDSYSNNLTLSYRNGSFTTKSDGSTSDNTYAMYNGSAKAQFAKSAWNDVSITIIPATGDFTVSLGGTALRASSNGSTTFNNSLIKELYDNNKSLSFQLYYHVGMRADTYIDDFTVTAKRETKDLPTTEELINAEFIDPSFSLIEPELEARNYDEWEIVENKYHIPSGVDQLIDFDGLTVGTALTNDSVNALFGDGLSSFSSTLSDSDVIQASLWKAVADPVTNGTRGNVISCVDATKGTFIINDENKLAMSNKFEISFDILLTEDFTFTSTTNLLWWSDNSFSNRKAILRYTMADGNGDGVKDIKLGYRTGESGNASYGNGEIAYLTVGTDTWHNVKVVMDISITGANNTWVSVDGKQYYAYEQKYFPANYSAESVSSVFGIHHSYGGFGNMGIYLDNVSFRVDVDESRYEQNYIVKTLEGDDGKLLSTLAIADSTRYLANHPFEVSFDYCMNQTPGYINLLRANINGTWFSLLRVTNNGTLTNYTSTGYAQITNPSSTSGKNLSLNVTGDKKLTAGEWYNMRVVVNPLNGHVMCYLDNTLISDYNLNEVYTDSNGVSLGVCDDLGANNPDKVIVEIAAASSSVTVNDSCLDNLRIRTLERREYKKTLIGKAEFDDLTANSALTPDSFMLTSGGIYTTAVTDGFTVKGSELGNYLLADVSAGKAIDIGLTTDYNPLAAGVIAFEGNFNISSFGSEGTLDLISLSRDGADALRILAVDHEGKLYMGTETSALYTLKEDELYTLKVLMSGASGLLTLYVNGDLITAGVSMGITAAPKLSYTDDMGTTLTYNNERFEAYFAYDEGAKRKTFSGLDLYEAELADFTSVSWPQDTLKILGVTGAGSWQVIADDISLTRDEYADLYYNNYENISALHGTSASPYGSFVAGMKLDKEDSNGFATMSGATGGGRVGFWDNNSILWGNDFVAQMDVRLNSLPESEYYNLFALVTGTAPGNTANWGSLLRLGADGTLYKPEKESNAYVSIGKQIPTEEWVNIAVVVSVDPWESPVKDTNRPVVVKVYVETEQVATYTARNITHMFDTLLRFCVEGSGKAIDIDIDNTRVYYGTTPRNNDLAPGTGDTAFDGYNAITIDFEDENFFAKAEMNAIDYLDWNYSPCGTTLVDKNGATVTLSEKVTSGDNSFFRMRRPSYGGSTSDKPVAYMDYNLGTFGDYGEVYSIEMDVRYTDTLGSSMNVVELFERNLTGSTVLLSILGTNDAHSNAYYFENDGIRYFLCNSSGKLLNVNPAGDGEFSEIGLVINETEGYYSIWIDGVGAYYYADGGTSGEVVSAHKVPLEYEKQPSATICDPVARLLKATDNDGSNSIIDIDNISIDIIKNGIAPVMSLYTQSGELGNAIRFIATVDTLYTNAVGFDVEIVSTISGTKKDSRESNIVYSSIKEKVGDEYFDVIAAEDERINGRYISVISIENLHTDIYEFSVTPYVIVFGEKISGASQTYSFNCETGTSSNE